MSKMTLTQPTAVPNMCRLVQTTTILLPKSDAITETTPYEIYFCSLTDKKTQIQLI